jgi:hypothetical protein
MNNFSKIIALAGGVVTLLTAGVVLALHAQAEVPPYFPTRLKNVSDSRQVIVVVGKSRTSSYATAYTYQKGSDGVWRAKFAAMAARNGWAGWVWGSQRVQNTGTSPMGTYRITTGFGLKTNPGTKVPYRLVDSNDYWVGDARGRLHLRHSVQLAGALEGQVRDVRGPFGRVEAAADDRAGAVDRVVVQVGDVAEIPEGHVVVEEDAAGGEGRSVGGERHG